MASITTAYRAVERLIDLGHRRIAVLVPSCNDRSISELRYNGYRAALRDRGVDFDAALLKETGSFEMRESYRGMTELIDSGARFTALFTVSDTAAIAAIRALEDRGLSVPGDCSVIAIDGLPISEFISPTLATMAQPVEEMARESVGILTGALEGRGGTAHLRLEARLRDGASVRAI